MKNLFFLFLIAIFINACEKPPGVRSYRVMWIENNSEMPISTLLGYEYPDTSIPDITGSEYRLKSASPSDKIGHDFRMTWKEVFEQLPHDTLSVFIFHRDTLERYNWEQIRTNYKLLDRIEISREDLERMNNTISFP